MGRVADTARTLRRSERGLTLVELLVAASIGMLVLGGAVTVFVGAVRSEPRTSSQVSAIERGRVAVERITRELRQGIAVQTAEPDQLVLITYVPPSSCGSPSAEAREPCRVTYACAEGECTRTVAEPDGGSPGAAVQVVDGLASSEVFAYTLAEAEPESEVEPEPTYVHVSLSFTTREGGPVTIADGVALRNGAS